MLEAMQASRAWRRGRGRRSATSWWIPGLRVAQLTKTPAGGTVRRVAAGEEDAAHGGIVGDHGEDHLGGRGDFGEAGAGFAAEFAGQFGGGLLR